MDVGCGFYFANYERRLPDDEVYKHELRMADLAEPLGYDSIWATEHHFTNYQMTPNPLQFLTYMAGRTTKLKLGTNAVILPWNDPMRVASQIALLEHFSGGRTLLGIGRGLGAVEFDGWNVPMEEARSRFIESAKMLLESLDSNFMESDGSYYSRPRREIRPNITGSFRRRTWAAAISPESFDIMAELGVGLLVAAQKPWDTIRADFQNYRKNFLEKNDGLEPPPAVGAAFIICDKDAGKARDLAHEYIGNYYATVMSHYELTGEHFAKTKGYEYYENASKMLNKVTDQQAKDFYTSLQVWGTPDECFEKVMHLRDVVHCGTFVANFNYSGIPYEDAESTMRTFACEVMPRLKAVPDMQVA